MTSSEQHTYKTIATVASAQGTLNLPGQVLLYVPFTKGRSFTAIVLTTSSRVLQAGGSGSIPRLQVRANTSAEALAKTLSFDLIKHGSAMLDSSGAAATAKAAAALQLVRQQLLSRGYEVGVVPRFEERKVGSCLVAWLVSAAAYVHTSWLSSWFQLLGEAVFLQCNLQCLLYSLLF